MKSVDVKIPAKRPRCESHKGAETIAVSTWSVTDSSVVLHGSHDHSAYSFVTRY